MACAHSAVAQAQRDRRLRDWFAATERYPRQLHEMEQGEYLDMKRKEHLRQQLSQKTTQVMAIPG